jgi:hypothetical protein
MVSVAMTSAGERVDMSSENFKNLSASDLKDALLAFETQGLYCPACFKATGELLPLIFCDDGGKSYFRHDDSVCVEDKQYDPYLDGQILRDAWLKCAANEIQSFEAFLEPTVKVFVWSKILSQSDRDQINQTKHIVIPRDTAKLDQPKPVPSMIPSHFGLDWDYGGIQTFILDLDTVSPEYLIDLTPLEVGKIIKIRYDSAHFYLVESIVEDCVSVRAVANKQHSLEHLDFLTLTVDKSKISHILDAVPAFAN